jgi:hypothetical protein
LATLSSSALFSADFVYVVFTRKYNLANLISLALYDAAANVRNDKLGCRNRRGELRSSTGSRFGCSQDFLVLSLRIRSGPTVTKRAAERAAYRAKSIAGIAMKIISASNNKSLNIRARSLIGFHGSDLVTSENGQSILTELEADKPDTTEPQGLPLPIQAWAEYSPSQLDPTIRQINPVSISCTQSPV